jgi:hypothetical protein
LGIESSSDTAFNAHCCLCAVVVPADSGLFNLFEIYIYHLKYFLMKKFMLKTRLGLLVVLGMLAFGFGATQASAQGLLNPTGALPDGGFNWVTPSEAQAILNQEIGTLDQQLQATTIESLDLKRKFYTAIATSIQQGQAIPKALDSSFIKFVPGYADVPVEVPNSLPLATWKTYYEDAALMLQN